MRRKASTLLIGEIFLLPVSGSGARPIARGNHPFGALLADADRQVVLTAENTVNTKQVATRAMEGHGARSQRTWANRVLRTVWGRRRAVRRAATRQGKNTSQVPLTR